MASMAFLVTYALAAILLAADDQGLVESLSAQSQLPSANPLPWKPDEWQIGTTGTLGGPEQGGFGFQDAPPDARPATYPPMVLQVLDERSCLAEYANRVVRIDGLRTKGIVDGILLHSDNVYRVAGKRSYVTSGGDTKTTWVLEVVRADEQNRGPLSDEEALISAYGTMRWINQRPVLAPGPDCWREGQVGWYGRNAKLLQVIDERNFLITETGMGVGNFVVWVEGSIADDRISGEKIVHVDGPFKVTTCRYETQAGSSKTIWKLVTWQQNSVAWERLRAHIAEREAARNEAQRQTRVRLWRDATGKFSVKAEYVGYKDGNVSLKREDNGQAISVPLARLCEEDRKWVRTEITNGIKSSVTANEPQDARTDVKSLRRTLAANEEALRRVEQRIDALRSSASDSKALSKLEAERDKLNQKISEIRGKLDNSGGT